LVIGDEQPDDRRPAESMPPELEKLQADARKLGILHQEEDLITYALYPQVAVKFLKGEIKEEAILSPMAASSPSAAAADFPSEFSVDVDGEVFNVKVSGVLGKTVSVEKPAKPKEVPKGAVVSSMQGMILSVRVKVGDKVAEGDVVATIEAMKMQNNIAAPSSGTVKEILVYESEVIDAGDVLKCRFKGTGSNGWIESQFL